MTGRAIFANARRSGHYFGTRRTVDVPAERLDRFVARSGVKAVCGYTQDVDWLESAAFDLLLIEALMRYRRMDAAENWLRKQYPSTVRQLGFKMRRR